MCNDKAVKVIISGFYGAMGSQVLQAACEDGMRNIIHIIGGLERSDHPGPCDFKTPWGEGGKVLCLFSGQIPKVMLPANVIIDFSKPAEASIANMKAAAEAHIPIVICSTGHSQEQKELIAEYARTIPCVLTPNTSVGANIFFRQMENAAKVMGPEDWDVEIFESHHRLKADGPSGTSLEIADRIAKGWGMEKAKLQYGWYGKTGIRPRGLIGIFPSRGGTIVGTHTIVFAGKGEHLEYTHVAESKAAFAHGAIRAAGWVVLQRPGIYEMGKDVLGLK
jgi:4-hydroxy-tetrahydrodipicolinate reductase